MPTPAVSVTGRRITRHAGGHHFIVVAHGPHLLLQPRGKRFIAAQSEAGGQTVAECHDTRPAGLYSATLATTPGVNIGSEASPPPQDTSDNHTSTKPATTGISCRVTSITFLLCYKLRSGAVTSSECSALGRQSL